jgi:hypothetical protein
LEPYVPDAREGRRRVDGLCRNDERVGLEELFRIVDHRRSRLDIRQARHDEPLLRDPTRALAPRDHDDIVSRPRQVRAQDGAQRARP